jgi:hypothetical protein
LILCVTALCCTAPAQEGADGFVTDFTGGVEIPLVKRGDYVLRGAALVQYQGKADAVHIPEDLGITAIGDNVFAESHIRSVVIPEGVTTIGARAFFDCYNLGSVSIPKTVTRIGDNAFTGGRVAEIRVDRANAAYAERGGVLFTRNFSTLIRYPAGKEETEYTVPAGVTRIGAGAFSGCEKLVSVRLPAGLVNIGDCAFYGCESLRAIKLPESLTGIGDEAFFWCSSLRTLTLPENLAGAGRGAFYGCEGLVSVEIPASLTVIGDDAFSECGNLTAFRVDRNNAVYAERDGVLFNKAIGKLVRYPPKKAGSTYTVPGGIIRIGDDAFEECKNLVSVLLPEGLTGIDNYAFYGCTNLRSVKLPQSLAGIGRSVFYGCESLQSIDLPALTPPGLGIWALTHSPAIIKVPAAALNAYKNAPGWKDYAGRIQAAED